VALLVGHPPLLRLVYVWAQPEQTLVDQFANLRRLRAFAVLSQPMVVHHVGALSPLPAHWINQVYLREALMIVRYF